jgi:aminodeoxyfutalosine deaminase
VSSDPMAQYIAGLPKAELHVHLEGAIEPTHLTRLAMRHKTELADGGERAVTALYATHDFAAFLNAFKVVCQHLRTPADYEFVTYRVLRGLSRQNVRYAEIILSAGVMLWNGQEIVPMFTGIDAGARKAQDEFGIRVQWIFDAVRQFPVEQAWTVARTAAKLRGRGVIGLGIGGDEAAAPAQAFKEVYDFARDQGLRLHAHAGEAAGPESIWDALELLRAERIGHGLAAVRDTRLMDHLASEQIPVEICLTSNLRTGGVTDLSQHPVREFFDRGLNVSLHTDDPALFGTSLNGEYLLAHQLFGFNKFELRRLAINSFESAFLTPQEKQAYLAAFAD